jgi:nucleoside phosphorylase
MPHRPRALILTALELETTAVLPYLESSDPVVRAGVGFYRGVLASDSRWDVIVGETSANNVNAATYAAAATREWKRAVTIFVGVCGGIEAEGVKEFDLIVPRSVHYYGLGTSKKRFTHRPLEQSVSLHLHEVARLTTRDRAWRDRVDPPANDSRIWLDPLASGDHVVKAIDSATYRLIRQISSKIVGVDMEGIGVLTATRLWQPTQTLIVRGVSDLISDKDPEHDLIRQPRAAGIAAAFAIDVLSRLTEDELTIVELDAPGHQHPQPNAVAVVRELDRLLNVDRWHRVTEGLFWADPPKWWQSFDESLLEAIAFLRARPPIPGAPEIDAALSNLGRVLIDLRVTLQKDAEPMNDPTAFWMRKYYRDAYGNPSLNQDKLAAQWEAECRLARNLALESTRAINLAHDRIRERHDSAYRLLEGRVGVFAGVEETFLPILYSSEEAGIGEPYPGLEGFSEALRTRTDAYLGDRGEAAE